MKIKKQQNWDLAHLEIAPDSMYFHVWTIRHTTQTKLRNIKKYIFQFAKFNQICLISSISLVLIADGIP
jgi:hypothetical protein